jgi:hypothetical protein
MELKPTGRTETKINVEFVNCALPPAAGVTG